MEFYSIAEAKKEFSEVIQKSKEQEIVITKNGKPVAMIVDFRRFGRIMDFISEVFELYLMDVGMTDSQGSFERHEIEELFIHTKEDTDV